MEHVGVANLVSVDLNASAQETVNAVQKISKLNVLNKVIKKCQSKSTVLVDQSVDVDPNVDVSLNVNAKK